MCAYSAYAYIRASDIRRFRYGHLWKEERTICKARLGSPLCCGDAHGQGKMSEISVKIIKEIRVGCRDDAMPKAVDTRRHCNVWLRACNNLPQPPPCFLGGCGRLLHALNHTLQCLLVSTDFGTMLSLYHIYL